MWRELSDGTAGPVIRVILTLALGALLSGGCLIGAYVLASMMPQWDRSSNWGGGGPREGVHPDDELLGWLFVVAGLLYLGAIAWIWSRSMKRHRAVWYAAMSTLVIAGVTIAACVLAEDALSGDEEIVVTGIAFVGGAVMLLVWVEAWRRYGRARPARDAQDGMLDVRCPECGYRMVGLHESRCPECGTAYTLEDLLARQEFITTRGGKTTLARVQAPPRTAAFQASPTPESQAQTSPTQTQRPQVSPGAAHASQDHRPLPLPPLPTAEAG